MADLVRWQEQDEQAPVAGAYTIGNEGQFDWSLPWAINCVQAACDYVEWQLGPAACPLAVYDCADGDGDTPAGRHPGRAHDVSPGMGVNMDLGYYLQASDGDAWAGPNDGAHLTGFPDRLDVPRQAHFYAALAWQCLQAEAQVTSGERLMRIMAMDGQVIGPVQQFMATMGLAQPTMDRAHELMHGEVQDQGTGWFAFHGDHTHLRFEYYDGSVGDQLATLFQQRETFEAAQWAIKLGGATAPSPTVQPPDVSPAGEQNGDHDQGHPLPPVQLPPEARQLPPGLHVQAGYDLHGHDWGTDPVVILGDGAYGPFIVAGRANLGVYALNAHGARVVGSRPGPGHGDDQEPPNGARFMDGCDGLVWDGVDLEGSEARGLRVTASADVILRNYRSTGHGLEALMVADCPNLTDEGSECGDSLDTQTYEGYGDDQKHAKYYSGNMTGLQARRHRCFKAPGSVQLNGASLQEHITGCTLEDFTLEELGSAGTPALSLMGFSDNQLTRFKFSHNNADVVMFDDGEGQEWGCHDNTFTDFTSDHAGRFSVHEISSGQNTWVNPQGFDVPASDRLVAGGSTTGSAPTPVTVVGSTADGLHVHPRGPWPKPPVVGATVLMDPGAYGELTIQGYAGATIQVVDPTNTSIRDLTISDHCEGLRLELLLTAPPVKAGT